MNAFKILTKDRQQTHDIFKKVEELSTGARRSHEDMAKKLKDELTRHAKPNLNVEAEQKER